MRFGRYFGNEQSIDGGTLVSALMGYTGEKTNNHTGENVLYSGNEQARDRAGRGNPCEYIDGPLATGLHAHIHPIAWGLWPGTIQ